MSVKSRFRVLILLVVVVFMGTGCAGAFANRATQPVEDTAVSSSIQYVQGPEVGPMYDVSVMVPPDWVGQFEVRNQGNAISFDYLGPTGPAQIFWIEALSPFQYWKQSGSYPGSFVNLINLGDTFFVYHLPIDSFFSGLPEDEFMAFAEAVPEVVATFQAQAQ